MAVLERPGRIIRLDVLASWRGLELIPRRGRWDLVPLGGTEQVVGGRRVRVREPAEASGLTIDEVEAYFAH